MKIVKATVASLSLILSLTIFSCGNVNDTEKTSAGSGSESQTTPNDSSAAASRKAMGTAEDNQKDSLGYPSNQSNLNADSTSRKHD
jgi:uncharacterized lipoprotein NlpE involved in copper resistance